MKPIEKNIDELIKQILKIPGDKILFLMSVNSVQQTMTMDVNENGEFGHGIGHKERFIAKLANAMFCGGSLIVTQFLPVKIKMNGAKIPIPLKNKYGFYLGNGGWYALSKEEVRDAFSKDHKTGKPITLEEDVLYQEMEICK
jgi:hypothetical protein